MTLSELGLSKGQQMNNICFSGHLLIPLVPELCCIHIAADYASPFAMEPLHLLQNYEKALAKVS